MLNNKNMAKIELKLSLNNDVSTLVECQKIILENLSSYMSKTTLSVQEDILEILKAFSSMEKASNGLTD